MANIFFDGNPRNIRRGRRFFSRHPDTWVRPPTFVQAWIDRDSVDDLFKAHNIVGEIDLLSIDLDGVDYWVWKGLNVVSPRVVVVEYREAWGADRAVTIPYRPDFDRSRGHPEYWGASLPAFVGLGKEKGYRLMGCDRSYNNALFVRNDIDATLLPEYSPAECVSTPHLDGAQRGIPRDDQHPWIDVAPTPTITPPGPA